MEEGAPCECPVRRQISLPEAVIGPVWKSEVVVLLLEACGEHLGSGEEGTVQLGSACEGPPSPPTLWGWPCPDSRRVRGCTSHLCLIPDL